MDLREPEFDGDFVFGKSPQMLTLSQQMAAAAGVEGNVLLVGESGTGKDLAARYVHQHSGRSDGPFVPVNCGAIPKELFESELFGHVRGAYTGAVSDTQGLFRAAEGGTIFLDEVTEIPPEIQVKLLRVLQDKRIRPLGATEEIQVDVRVIAATNRSVDRELGQGTLREDFFYRLSVITLRLPPLRERFEDISDLVTHFLGRLNQRFDRKVEQLDTVLLDQLSHYSWPGNVRQLENAIANAFITSEHDHIPEVELDAGDGRTLRFTQMSEIHHYLIPREDEWFLPILSLELEKRIRIAARSTGGVLIFGEEGCGSRFLAREVQRLGPSPDGPFITVDCDAIPADQIESQLFGDKQNESLQRSSNGYLKQAQKGTLFLREVTALPLSLQIKLAEIGDQYLIVPDAEIIRHQDSFQNIRIVAYTSKDLDEALEDGSFSIRLYARLSAFSIYTPPIRELRDQIPEFVDHFVQMFSARFQRQNCEFDDEALLHLTAYPWPGNLLEMAYVIQGAMLAANFGRVLKTHLPDRVRMYSVENLGQVESNRLEDIEQALLLDTLQKAGGNKVQAAEMLGISRNRLYRMLRKKPI